VTQRRQRATQKHLVVSFNYLVGAGAERSRARGLPVITSKGPQHAGLKTRMRQFGEVEIPQSGFIAALKTGDG
jgi:hypothetical protein